MLTTGVLDKIYYLRFFAFWAKALPAADFEVFEVRPSRNVLDAAFAAFVEVCFLGALRWERALPAEDLDFELVDLLVSVLEAALAAFLPVTFLLATIIPLIVGLKGPSFEKQHYILIK